MTTPADAYRTISYHQMLLNDRTRTEAYRQAVREVVRQGDVVVDLGTGSGILTLFACRAGASRIHSIDAGPAVELARVLAEANGYADRVSFWKDLSTAVRLPEPADVLITETLGNGGLDEAILGWVLDARRRLLKPEARIIPREIEIMIAPVQMDDFYRNFDIWSSASYETDLSQLRSHALNCMWVSVVDTQNLLGSPASLARVDLARLDSPKVEGEVRFRMTRSGRLHALACWFKARLSENITLTNEPPLQTPSWNHLILPLEHEIEVASGDQLEAHVTTYDGREWRWRVVHSRGGDAPLASLDQATLKGFPLSPADFLRQSPDYAPELTPRLRALQFLLGKIDGRTSIADLRRWLMDEHPDLFPSDSSATRFISRVID